MSSNAGENGGTTLTAPIQGSSTPSNRPSSWFKQGEDARRGTGIKGVGGRPASLVRAAARLAFAERIELLCAIADGAPLPHTRKYLPKAGKRLPDGTICTKEQEDAGTIVEVHWEESADLDQRMKAVQMLGSFGGLNATAVVDGEGNEVKPKAVYVVTFD